MILLRHGQSEFNLHFSATRRDPGIPDPKLTQLGHEQAAAAAAALASRPVRHLISSPYTRALQTAAPLAEALGLPVTVNPLARERYAFTCDIGSPRTELELAFPTHDFSVIDEIWWPVTEEPEPEVRARAALFRAEMAALPTWRDAIVVAHWGFIMAMTGVSVQNGHWLECDPTAPGPENIVWKV